MDLYKVKTIVKEYDGCKDVPFWWFCCDERKDDRPYKELIENYDPGDDYAAYPKGYIDEKFTLIEAHALKDYLDREHGDEGTTTVMKVKLPIPNDTMGNRAIPIGGSCDNYRLHREKNYSLSFKVEGFLDLRGCELADGSGETFRPYLLIACGKIRRETQEEARRREGTSKRAKEVEPW